MKKTALITGASGGIGRELARIHAEKGGDLIVVARRLEKLKELKDELEQKHKVQVVPIAKDLGAPGAAKEIFDEVKEKNIQVDYLINNAGFGLRGKFHELSWERQSGMINLNMTVLTELMYLFLPLMVARNSGKILNTSSTASLTPGPLQAVYYATKAYVTFLSNAVAEELHDTNITVTALMPGPTSTGFASTAGLDGTDGFKKTASPRRVAEDGYNAMMNGKLDVISGLPFSQRVSLSMIPLLPKRMVLKQIRALQELN